MNKSVLQNGDLLFMSDESDLSKAIIETTEKYSHVGIFFDGMFYHASRKRGVAKQKLEEYLSEEKHEIFIYRYLNISNLRYNSLEITKNDIFNFINMFIRYSSHNILFNKLYVLN